jgi:hypothetical protein
VPELYVQVFSWCSTSAASRSLVLQSKLAKGSAYPETNFETQTSYREYISRSQLEDFMYVCIFEVAEEQLNIRRKYGNLASGQPL